MDPTLLYFASGESLYGGACLLILMATISPLLSNGWALRARNVGACVALAMMVMACPPFSWVVDAFFGAVFLAWFVAYNRASFGQPMSKARMVILPLMSLLLFALTASEWLHRRIPVIKSDPSDNLVVIGDSISSGLGTRNPAWPSVFQELTGIRVKNLSKPGATTADGEAMTNEVTAADRLVLIELGGNDLISGEPADNFSRRLDAMLQRLASPGRNVLMFELPLLPNRIAYGRIQRRLAAKYQVSLIPKRCLAGVLGGRGATSDGLHLTETGAREMAQVVIRILSPILLTRSNVSTDPSTHP